MATLVTPEGTVCEVEGEALIASLRADGWSLRVEEKPKRVTRAKSSK